MEAGRLRGDIGPNLEIAALLEDASELDYDLIGIRVDPANCWGIVCNDR